MPRLTVLERRIQAGLDKFTARGAKVRAIYLDEADQRTLNQILSRRLGGATVEALSVGDIPIISADVRFNGVAIRPGNCSKIYDQHGVGLAIPKLPPPAKEKGETSAATQKGDQARGRA